MRRAFRALPIAAQMPWPSDPVATSTKGKRGVGCPSRSDPIVRSFSSSLRSNAPASAQPAYRSGAAWPFESTNRSLSSWWGSFGSKRISAKNSAATTSAAEQQLVGCPLPASEVDLTESMRRRVATFFNAGISNDRSTVKILSQDSEPLGERKTVGGALQTLLPVGFVLDGQDPRHIAVVIGTGSQH